MLYRKFFWDFVGGIVRAPGGIQPSPKVAFLITLIVRAPIIQIFSMFIGIGIAALEYPVPFLKKTSVHRNFAFKAIMLVVQALFAILYYQGTNGAIWSLIAAGCYVRAMSLGEEMEVAKDNRGRSGKA